MEKDIKVLLIPDVHCRGFWEEPVKWTLENTNAKIVFLGDYLDAYPREWGNDSNYKLKGIEGLINIVKLKMDNPDRITLLLGNHDCTYAISEDICNCRTDEDNFDNIASVFHENRKDFQLIDHAEINGKKFLFSHAGVKKTFINTYVKKDLNFESYYNNAWQTDNMDILWTLGVYDFYRGWGGVKDASFVWSDVRSWFGEQTGKPLDEGFGYQIFGHTRLGEEKDPIVTDNFAMIDCSRAFYLDSEGVLRDYNTEEICKKNGTEDD